MLGRVLFECLLTADGPFDIRLWHFVFLRERMPQNRQVSPMKEVEDSVVHAAFPNPQLVDAIPEDVSKRSPQIVSELGQTANGSDANLICSLIGAAKFLEPIEHWNISPVLLVKDDINPRHAASSSNYHNIVIQSSGMIVHTVQREEVRTVPVCRSVNLAIFRTLGRLFQISTSRPPGQCAASADSWFSFVNCAARPFPCRGSVEVDTAMVLLVSMVNIRMPLE